MAGKKDEGRLKCSFCGKTQDQVRKLIAGPGVYICEQCVDLCNEIIEDELDSGNLSYDNEAEINPLKPKISSFVPNPFSLPNGMPMSVSCPLPLSVSSRLCLPLLQPADVPDFCLESEESATLLGRQPIVTQRPRLANAA